MLTVIRQHYRYREERISGEQRIVTKTYISQTHAYLSYALCPPTKNCSSKTPHKASFLDTATLDLSTEVNSKQKSMHLCVQMHTHVSLTRDLVAQHASMECARVIHVDVHHTRVYGNGFSSLNCAPKTT